MKSEWELSKADLDKVIMLEPKNSEAIGSLKIVTNKLDSIMFNKYREEANELLK